VDDAFAVIAEPKTGFGDAALRQQLGRHGAAFGVVQLEHPGPRACCQLQDVRPVGGFTDPKRRLGLGVKTPGRSPGQRHKRRPRCGCGADLGDAIKPQAFKRRQQGHRLFVGNRVSVLHGP